jgi:putative redox protein
MKVELELEENMRIKGIDAKEHTTYFDTNDAGGNGTAASPMSIMLQSLGACTFMDVISILRKKHKTINSMKIEIEADRANEHPKVFTNAHLKYILISPDTSIDDFNTAIKLSEDKYCSVSAMFQRSGCEVTWEGIVQQ